MALSLPPYGHQWLLSTWAEDASFAQVAVRFRPGWRPGSRWNGIVGWLARPCSVSSARGGDLGDLDGRVALDMAELSLGLRAFGGSGVAEDRAERYGASSRFASSAASAMSTAARGLAAGGKA